jgi:hypothetical protein
MISSEVQRTLVKSPPELWAEISDPEALARHLGEFGEIRITRVQPEQKVEWEAPEASGSIVIKPSGWGTKVKLTVTRELGESEAGLEPSRPPELDAAPSAEQTQDVHGERDTGAEIHSERETDAELHGEAEFAAEDELFAEDGLELEQAAEDPIPPSFSFADPESDLAPEPASEDDVLHERETQPERRLGFFARLFGRRRAARTPIAADGDSQALPSESSEELERASVAQLALVEHEEAVTRSPQTDDDAPNSTSASGEEIVSGDTPLLGEGIALGAEVQPEASEVEASRTHIAPTTPAAAVVSGAVERLETDDNDEHRSPTDPSSDLVAELEQAEEAATEHVTAVLTGVLDRLGAAHHRPFSRA